MKFDLSSTRIIDLSYSYSNETIYWPTEEGFKFEVEHHGLTEKGYYYSANKFCSAEHGGTHIDAPIHFAEKGTSIDQIPLERLIGPGIVIDVAKKSQNNPDYQITPKDFVDWEEENGKIEKGTIVFLRTGYGKFWPDKKKYFGTTKTGKEALDDLHFPGLHPDSALLIANEKRVMAIGIDTPSIDYGQSKMFEAHQRLCHNNIPAFENVANLKDLPEKGFFVFALPMKIKGGSGAPLRLVAFI